MILKCFIQAEITKQIEEAQRNIAEHQKAEVCTCTCMCCFALFVCLTLLASFFLPSHLSFKNMYILGLVFGFIGGFITPAFSFILS